MVVSAAQGAGLIKEKESTNDFTRYINGVGINPEFHPLAQAQTVIEQHQNDGWQLFSVTGTTPNGMTHEQYNDTNYQPDYNGMTWFVVFTKASGIFLSHIAFA